MNYPDSLNELIESFKKLPGIGEKTAERLAFSVMNMDNDTVILFSNSLKNVKNKIKRCTICGNITENNICDICKNEARDNNIICVVEDVRDIIAIERTHEYKGVFH